MLCIGHDDDGPETDESRDWAAYNGRSTVLMLFEKCLVHQLEIKHAGALFSHDTEQLLCTGQPDWQSNAGHDSSRARRQIDPSWLQFAPEDEIAFQDNFPILMASEVCFHAYCCNSGLNYLCRVGQRL